MLQAILALLFPYHAYFQTNISSIHFLSFALISLLDSTSIGVNLDIFALSWAIMLLVLNRPLLGPLLAPLLCITSPATKTEVTVMAVVVMKVGVFAPSTISIHPKRMNHTVDVFNNNKCREEESCSKKRVSDPENYGNDTRVQ